MSGYTLGLLPAFWSRYKWVFMYKILRLGSEDQDLKPTYLCVIIIPPGAFLLLYKRKIVTIALFSHRVVQAVEKIIHEYTLENIVQPGGMFLVGLPGISPTRVWLSDRLSVRSRWEGGWSLALISNTSE